MGSYPEATRDAGKRGLLGAQLELVKNLFERRPIWTKIAVEHESKLGAFALKYILPCVAYFALNGPWRSCWIRYGYDPRMDRFAYVYQLLDYRIPSKFRLNSTNMRSILNFEGHRLIKGVFLFISFSDPYRAVMERKKNATVDVDRESLFSFKPNTVPPKCQMIYQVRILLCILAAVSKSLCGNYQFMMLKLIVFLPGCDVVVWDPDKGSGWAQ